MAVAEHTTYPNILKYGLQASYNALATKDANVIYFCTDSKKIYKGDIDFTDSVVYSTQNSDVTAPIIGKLYVFSTTGTCEVYNGTSWGNFWCFYCFVLGGITLISIVMQPEGNYIDLLMTRQQSILNMLHAKYLLNTVLLVIPLVILLIPVFMGKWSLMMVLGFLLFTAGFQFCLLFQLAVYNNRTIPLTKSLTNRDGSNNSPWQIVVTMLALALPMGLVGLMSIFFSETVINSTLAVLGLAFIAAEPLWMKNIYGRMMARKYENLSGFHSTRTS